MSILSAIRSWTTEIGVYHAGSLYREDNFPLYWLVRKVLSKVRISDETAEGLKSLSEKGVVVYALKNKSQLNSLILRELSRAEGDPPARLLSRHQYDHLAAVFDGPPGDPVPSFPADLQKDRPRSRTGRII